MATSPVTAAARSGTIEKEQTPSRASFISFQVVYFGFAGGARLAIDVDADLRESDPRPQSPQVALVFGQPAKRRHDRLPQQREIAGVERQLRVRQRRDDPVEGSIREAQQPAFLARAPPREDDVGACAMVRDELGDDFGLDPAGRRPSAPPHRRWRSRARRRALPDVRSFSTARRRGCADRASPPPREAPRIVAAAVVDEDDLVRAAFDADRARSAAARAARGGLPAR